MTSQEPSPADHIRKAVEALKASGVQFRTDESILSDGMPILIAEAVNWAAKTISRDFYRYKTDVLNALVAMGYECGRGEDGVIYVRHPAVGVAAFHDPYGEVEVTKSWPYGWIAIFRQEYAFITLANRDVRRLIAETTDPDGQLTMTDAALRRAIARLLQSDRKTF